MNIAATDFAGPFLYARGGDSQRITLAALVLAATGVEPPLLRSSDGAVEPRQIWQNRTKTAWRYDFALPARADANYFFDGERLPVSADFDRDLRLAYVSCNGKENEQFEPTAERRNDVWRQLAEQHRREPFQLLLHGGDQIYADDVWDCHPQIAAWHRDVEAGKARRVDFSDEMANAALQFYIERYLLVYLQPPTRYLLARVPSLMMWDDHDIFDGWGSHRSEIQDSPIAQGVYRAARRAFCLFQLCAAEDELPGQVADRYGISLSWRVHYPRLSLLAPDLRSERGQRNVMGAHGWRLLESMFDEIEPGSRALLLSSVPVVGPRLSLIEAAMRVLPQAQKYEDDLRDQWQSYAHRNEWRRLLELFERYATTRDLNLTLLSGEIHLATRGVCEFDGNNVHQLVASGIAHPAPPAGYARALGLLAWLGENPLPGRPTRLRPLPGRKQIYVASRNFLTLSRVAENWRARWWLEDGGWTPPLML